MRGLRILIATIVFGASLLLIGGTASATDISGTISSTLTITEDSQLVGNVICTVTGAACIAIGASGITLKLNGFSITGPGDPATGCGGTSVGTESGINVNNQRGVVIRGPGVVQRFRGSGIRLFTNTRALVTQVTASTNCMAGIWVIDGSDNELEANISVRNGNATVPCGGIWLAGGTSRNRLRGNRLSGNGYAAQGNNFGIGIVAPGTNDNVIVDNTIVGNANGIVLLAGEGNFIRGNIIVGNPPVQVSVNNPTTTGVDIRNNTAPGANTFEDNFCLTAVNAACPAVDDTPRRQR